MNQAGRLHNTVPSKKRKRVVLSIEQKQEVIHHLNRGDIPSQVALSFGVSRQQISDIKKNADRIQNYCRNSSEFKSNVKRKVMKYDDDPAVEKTLYHWYSKERLENRYVTQSKLQEKATELFREINPRKSRYTALFKVSNAWIRTFKRKYGIESIDTHQIGDLPDDLGHVPPPLLSPEGANNYLKSNTVSFDGCDHYSYLFQRVNRNELLMIDSIEQFGKRMESFQSLAIHKLNSLQGQVDQLRQTVDSKSSRI